MALAKHERRIPGLRLAPGSDDHAAHPVPLTVTAHPVRTGESPARDAAPCHTARERAPSWVVRGSAGQHIGLFPWACSGLGIRWPGRELGCSALAARVAHPRAGTRPGFGSLLSLAGVGIPQFLKRVSWGRPQRIRRALSIGWLTSGWQRVGVRRRRREEEHPRISSDPGCADGRRQAVSPRLHSDQGKEPSSPRAKTPRPSLQNALQSKEAT